MPRAASVGKFRGYDSEQTSDPRGRFGITAFRTATQMIRATGILTYDRLAWWDLYGFRHFHGKNLSHLQPNETIVWDDANEGYWTYSI